MSNGSMLLSKGVSVNTTPSSESVISGKVDRGALTVSYSTVSKTGSCKDVSLENDDCSKDVCSKFRLEADGGVTGVNLLDTFKDDVTGVDFSILLNSL